MVFRFRMLSDENDRFVRDYEVMYDMTLLDFHNFILSSLEYEPCMASFFTADDRWEKKREFTLMDMNDGSADAPETMERVRLGQIIHNNRDRLIYLFDLFGDRAYYLELTGARREPPIRARFSPRPTLRISTTRRKTVRRRTRGRLSTR